MKAIINDPNIIPVDDSKLIIGQFYNAATKTMRLAFENGAEYDYAGVPQGAYDQFMSAPKKDDWLRANMGGKKFTFTQVTGPQEKS